MQLRVEKLADWRVLSLGEKWAVLSENESVALMDSERVVLKVEAMGIYMDLQSV